MSKSDANCAPEDFATRIHYIGKGGRPSLQDNQPPFSLYCHEPYSTRVDIIRFLIVLLHLIKTNSRYRGLQKNADRQFVLSGFAETYGTACLRERAWNGKQKENGLTNAACGHYNVLRQMNSRCICAVRRGALPHGRVMGMRMRFPGYPSNREADERSKAIAQARRRQVG